MRLKIDSSSSVAAARSSDRVLQVQNITLDIIRLLVAACSDFEASHIWNVPRMCNKLRSILDHWRGPAPTAIYHRTYQSDSIPWLACKLDPLSSRAAPGPHPRYIEQISEPFVSLLLAAFQTIFRAATVAAAADRSGSIVPTDVLLRVMPPTSGVPQLARRSNRSGSLLKMLHCPYSSEPACRDKLSCATRSARLGVNGIEAALDDDELLHVVGVMWSRSPRDAGAKMLQRALDRRHALAIKQYAKAKDEAA